MNIYIYIYIDFVYGFYGLSIKESFEHILQLGGLYQIVQIVYKLSPK